VVSNQSQDFFEHSDANHAALEELGRVLGDLGFKVQKKSRKEVTLRVYPAELHKHLLLNPRFESYDGAVSFLEFTVTSKGDDPLLDQHLRAFKSTDPCEFKALGKKWSGFHARFVMPLSFVGTSTNDLNFAILAESFLNIRNHLLNYLS
jgi:hypothetical protein